MCLELTRFECDKVKVKTRAEEFDDSSLGKVIE